MDFSFWGFVKDNVYTPPMPVDLQELRDRIVNDIALVDFTFLNKLWDELEYRLDICRTTWDSHIEHL
jgi:6-pyruvoyl-tetrahydropterin synthase